MQDFIDRQFFNLTVFTLVFGVMFYDIIHILGFSYVDEICTVLLLMLFGYKMLHTKTWEFNKMFLLVCGIFVFYLIYSIVIRANSTVAILTDFVIQIKPYLAFFCVYAIHPKLTENQRKIIRQLVLLCSLYILFTGVVYHLYYEVIKYTFGHVSRLATASTILALLYLYCSDYTKTDRMIFLLLLSLGILSERSKHFGFFAICLLVMLYFNESFKMKLNLKNSMFMIIAITFVLFVAREKIYFYFITGGFGDGRTPNDLFARMALYYFSLPILTDYFPFGTGFATYATFASGIYYSPVYAKYDLQDMHGLTKDAP
ncbi:MAG: O-antigen ligase domain-containing protein, partial [Tannerella sp.]|nr:O-antigen ligase domain-containing protein [Tannerella sp.]